MEIISDFEKRIFHRMVDLKARLKELVRKKVQATLWRSFCCKVVDNNESIAEGKCEVLRKGFSHKKTEPCLVANKNAFVERTN